MMKELWARSKAPFWYSLLPQILLQNILGIAVKKDEVLIQSNVDSSDDEILEPVLRDLKVKDDILHHVFYYIFLWRMQSQLAKKYYWVLVLRIS